MSAEKRAWLIERGLLNPDGSRPPHVPPESEPVYDEMVITADDVAVIQADAVAEAEPVVVTTEQEG